MFDVGYEQAKARLADEMLRNLGYETKSPIHAAIQQLTQR